MDDRPRNLRAMLAEVKDLSELMVDLAYAALYFGDPDMAEEVGALEDVTPLLVDDHALDVHDVVVLEDVLARDEVLFLDLLLGVLDLLREDRSLHGLVVGELEALDDVVDAVAGEEADELVLGGEVET